MTVAYLAHPLGESDADWGAARGDNIASAIDWFRFLRNVTRWAICYPAMAYVAADTALQRPSQITGQVEIMQACDVLVLAGGHMSPHMRIEVASAASRVDRGPMPVLDLLRHGRHPPWAERDVVVLEIVRQAQAMGL